MKKIIKLFVLSVAFLPAFALATTNVNLSSVKTNVNAGDIFTVNVTVSPSGEIVYTSKVVFNYNSSLLEATSFSFAPIWLPLSQPGYDSMDQTNGVIIKTAGYPSGMTSAKTFGAITFRAKQSGTATISVAKSTEIYDANNKNIFSGNPGAVSINVSKTEVAPVKEVVNTTKATVLTPKTSETISATKTTENTLTTEATNTANTASVVESKMGINYLGYIITIIITFIAGFFLGRRELFKF